MGRFGNDFMTVPPLIRGLCGMPEIWQMELGSAVQMPEEKGLNFVAGGRGRSKFTKMVFMKHKF